MAEIYRLRWDGDAIYGLMWSDGAPVGLAAETDTALALLPLQFLPVGLAANADAALALAPVQLTAAGLAAEANSALALVPVQAAAVGAADETNAALAPSPGSSGSAGLAVEADTALALQAIQAAPAGLAAELDSAFALDASGIQAVETDAALALSGAQLLPAGMAVETDTALQLPVAAVGPVGVATESDAVLALAPLQVRLTGLAVETDVALALGQPIDTAALPSTAFFLELAALAQELIAENGRSVKIQQLRGAAVDVSKPWKGPGAPTVETERDVMAAFVPSAGAGFGRGFVRESLLARVDQVALVAPADIALGAFDVILDAGVRWKVDWAQELRPADVTVLYAFGVKR